MLPGGDRISHYKGVSWSDSTPVIVRNRLIDAFRSDGRISALSSDEHSLHADLELVSDLRAFQIEYQNGKPNAVIGLDVRLVRAPDYRILASYRFNITQTASGILVPEVVQAFGTAGDILASQLVGWTLEHATARRER